MKRFLYLTVALLCAVMSVQANDYLEHSEHYTVLNVGNGVYRFTIPIWVYGGWNNYYLSSSNALDNTSDSYIWYSLKPDNLSSSAMV